MIKKVISGGQTGADIAGLKAAHAFDIETGGLAPMNFQTENGPDKTLGIIFKLKETIVPGYHYRTVENVKSSTGTVLFMYKNSAGSRLTAEACLATKKPCFIMTEHYTKENLNQKMKEFHEWIKENKIEILNVAGNRESVSPGIYFHVFSFLSFYFDYAINNE